MILYQFAQDVTERDVAFLNSGRDRGRDDKGMIDQPGQLSAVGAGPSNRDQAAVTSCCDPFQDVRGIPAGADADGDVAWAAVRSDLAGKEFFVPIVVGDTGNGGDIRRQRDRGKRYPFTPVSSHELSRNVRGVGRASAVPEEEHFFVVAECIGDERRNLYDAIGVFAGELLLDCRALGKGR